MSAAAVQMRCKFKAVLGLIENNSPKIMSAETSADATESDVLDPRTVFCTRGGLFTGLRVRDALEPNPAGSSVGLDICCTTSVYVEGLGDFGDSCVQLGNGAILHACARLTRDRLHQLFQNIRRQGSQKSAQKVCLKVFALCSHSGRASRRGVGQGGALQRNIRGV